VILPDATSAAKCAFMSACLAAISAAVGGVLFASLFLFVDVLEGCEEFAIVVLAAIVAVVDIAITPSAAAAPILIILFLFIFYLLVVLS
jgi:hypothetical protein